jgi:Alginate export
MRHECFIPVLLVMPFIARADEMNTTGEFPSAPPAYNMLRFDENYSCLANPSNRTDWFDPVKYISLRSHDPSWYLTFGGELRERFEGNYNPNFGIGDAGADSYLLQRVTLLADLHLGERVRFFTEGISGVMTGESQPAPPVQQDPIDLQFAFLDVVPYLADDESLTLRAGRFGMSFGSGRLVATRAAPNIPFRFDGFESIYSRPLWMATAFLTRPVEDIGSLSGSDPGTTFWGLYVTHWFDAQHQLGVDLYYLGIYNDQATYASGTADERRHSFGVRIFGERNRWDWNEEGVLQTGTFGNNSILAWTASFDSGYTFDARWQPRLGLKFDVTSGSGSTSGGRQETFDALYFKSGYFNDASLLRPQNIIDVHPNAGLKLTHTLSVDGGADVFWRYSKNDAVYGVPGNIAIPASDSASSYVGTALDVNLTWQIQRHVSFQASYVHFFSGSYIQQAGGSDVDYFSTTLDFLF